MAGLRAKQKEDRKQRILEAARQQFRTANYRDVTVEAIAEAANLSAMTVFNYYGSKGGLLLSLVAESDRHLIRKIDEVLVAEFPDAGSAVMAFSLTIFDHAFSYLDQQTWARVLATAILEGDSTFGSGFAALEQELKNRLAQLLDKLKRNHLIDTACDTAISATVIYNVHNARFVEFAADPDTSRNEIDTLTAQDIQFVMDLITPS
jgi:AcrR family transcriptional regulator